MQKEQTHITQKIFKIIRRILYPLSNGCVFQTKQAQEYYQNIIKCETKVIRNPLNPDFKVKPFDGIRTKRIVTMGRLSIEKNQIMLIDAFSKIAKCYPEYILEIYGDGPLRSELQQQIKTLNMENKIILKGRKDNIQQYIFDAEIFVLPSNSEGMPNALLESMALGLACISTDCPIGGAAVIIENEKNGLLIPMNDVDALVQSIKILIEDSKFAHKLRLEAVKVLDDFDAVNVCMNWEIYLKNVVENYKIRNK